MAVTMLINKQSVQFQPYNFPSLVNSKPCVICIWEHAKHALAQGRRQRGGQWCPALPFKICGPPVAAYIQYCF